MTDRLTPSQRHYVMSRIHGKGTKPELLVRQWLWRHGYRYRLNVKSVPGRPDIVLRKYRTAVFVNGCFWHGHFVKFGVESLEFRVDSQWRVESGELKVDSSKCCKIPQTNREFWVSKIRRNQERDQKNYQLLRDNGWQVIVVWECQLKPKLLENTMLQVELLLNERFLALHQPKPIPYNLENETPVSMAAEDFSGW